MRFQPPMPQATTPRAAQAPGADVVVQKGPTTALQLLRQQAGDLSQQLAGLRAERIVLERQLRSSNMDPAALNRLTVRHDAVVEQIVQVESQLASVRAQIAARQGTEQIINVPPPSFTRNRQPDPDMVIGLTFGLLMIVAIPLSIAWAKRIWKGKPQPAAATNLDEIAPRLARLEQAVDAIAIEVERISEGQRFVTKVLAERPAEAAPLALGAGPAEPVRVSERQAVRSPITPH